MRCSQADQRRERRGDDRHARRRERHEGEGDGGAGQPGDDRRGGCGPPRRAARGRRRRRSRRGPRPAGSPSTGPATTPITVPETHADACAAVAPMSRPRSKLPSPRLAITKEASTIVWPCAARASGPPRSEGPMAKPMGSQRAFMSIPAAIAATAPPPAARTLSAANWAAPENTRIDMAIGADGTHDRPRQHAEGHSEGERRQDERQPCAHSGAHVAVLVHLGYLTGLRLHTGKIERVGVSPETIKLWGGSLCLDFANSVDWSPAGDPLAPATDALLSARALARWGRRLGVVRARRLPVGGEEELAAARALRLVAAPHLLGRRAGSPAGARGPRGACA